MSSTTFDHSRRARGGFGWYAAILGIVVGLVGIILASGGVYLIILGGSWYYAITGLLLVWAGVLMVLNRRMGALIYGLIWLGTLIWAFWEVTLDGWQPASDWWALVPRIVAPTVILVLVLIALPGLRRHQAVARSALLVLGLGLVPGWTSAPPAQAQDSVAPAGPTTDQPAGATGAAADPATPSTAPTETLPPIAAPAAAPAAAGNEEAGSAPNAATTDSNGVAVSPVIAEDKERPADVLPPVGEDWPAYGGSESAQRYSPLDQINTDNVASLEQVWSFHTGDLPSDESEGKYSPENTPLKIGDTLYVCSPMNQIIALDAATGLEAWRYDPKVSPDAIPYGATCKGLAYHAQPDLDPGQLCATRLIMGTLDARLIAVDAATGQLCPDFGSGGQVNLEEGLGHTVPGWYAVTSAPVIVRGVVITGAQVSDNQANDAPSGVVRGYDAITGEFMWAWDLGKGGAVGEPAEGETYTRGTPNMWTTATGDQELGYVYLPLGNSSSDYWGPDRSEAENEYASSLVALDATTGEEAWHFQTVHHDVWDYDLGSQVTLVDFPSGDGTVPALILSSKQGQIYILNRQTGESLFPVEEREVTTTGGAQTEYMSATQPYSGYANLTKPDITEEQMWGMSPIDQLWCRIQFRLAHYTGQYTPPSADKPFIEYPGYNGGSDWGSVAIDPERGILIANYNDVPNYSQLIPRDAAESEDIKAFGEDNGDVSAMEGVPYAIDVNAGWRVPGTGMLCKQPPYGWIRGIELSTGKTLWDHPFGSAERNGPFGIPSMLPFTIGTPNNGGPVTTAGGLTFVAATSDNKLRAFNTETGEELWSTDLPAGGQATPMIYEAGGKQFVVIYPGGHHFMETPVGDEVVAYALPE
ncbi:membrane-bound PQQ-dependent dehydrogenase, glucose/quinate/shikimate family [Devosia sp. PTR5]|uniref:Membrane-bound PQQ-dependent dehydrogenase, glucose/quinate/shikimate family n=1 Tax=Devosia oryzisoli TaxID=2774138 RepID=A0A927FTQ8_9HYPH|nr:membrane-bound PQQ-dependent dehydrogenase, glucose/quinate/shikimate family [Devosia oryzisoli]MBD8064509.1 membrane-bound PQQ-dependent dehydrogenase, glucose/quinate/shikimate family [Devosia oryzisoli]